jgi:hypothetical protein
MSSSMQALQGFFPLFAAVGVDGDLVDAGEGELALEGHVEDVDQDDVGAGQEAPRQAYGLDRAGGEIHRGEDPAVGLVGRLLDHQHWPGRGTAQQARGGGAEQPVAQEGFAAGADDEQVGIFGVSLGGDHVGRGAGADAQAGGDALVMGGIGEQCAQAVAGGVLEALPDLRAAVTQQPAQGVEGPEVQGVEHGVAGAAGGGQLEAPVHGVAGGG